MSGQVSCPKGCGDLEYKNERPGKAIFLFVVGAISLIAAVYELLFDGDLFLPFMFGVVGLWVIYYGFSVGKLSRLKCGVCKGVLIETKPVSYTHLTLPTKA